MCESLDDLIDAIGTWDPERTVAFLERVVTRSLSKYTLSSESVSELAHFAT
jgi:hypothetical protein